MFNKPPNFPITAKCKWKTLDESQCLGVDNLTRLLYEQSHRLHSLQGLCLGAGDEKITAEGFRCDSTHVFPLTRENSIYLHKCVFVYVA